MKTAGTGNASKELLEERAEKCEAASILGVGMENSDPNRKRKKELNKA